jgi:uncharacterized membrane protein YfcA
MLELSTIAVVVATFLLAGAVKGVVGLGLPTISLALLTVAFDLTTAMVLLLVPSFVTNLWQAVSGGKLRAVCLRTWPFLVAATLSVWLGASIAAHVPSDKLVALLGVLLVFYAGISLVHAPFKVTPVLENWIAPLGGLANGIFTGMTGSFVVPGVMYLQAIGLSRDVLVQAMGVLFTLSTIALAFNLQRNALLTTELSLVSTAAVVPAGFGLFVGQRLRRKLSEDRFRQVFFVAILMLGAYITFTAMISLR